MGTAGCGVCIRWLPPGAFDDDPVVLVLFDEWQHHAFVTNRTGNAVVLDREHRAHATIELAIRDLKQGSGLNDCPSGVFNAEPTTPAAKPDTSVRERISIRRLWS